MKDQRAKKISQTTEVESQSVMIEVPVSDAERAGYQFRNLQFVGTPLTSEQADALRRMYTGLREANAELANHKPVVYQADVVKWILERAIS